MDPEKFGELVRVLRLVKSTHPDFNPRDFADFAEFTQEQRKYVEREFGVKRKILIDNSLYYNYYEDDDEDF